MVEMGQVARQAPRQKPTGTGGGGSAYHGGVPPGAGGGGYGTAGQGFSQYNGGTTMEARNVYGNSNIDILYGVPVVAVGETMATTRRAQEGVEQRKHLYIFAENHQRGTMR